MNLATPIISSIPKRCKLSICRAGSEEKWREGEMKYLAIAILVLFPGAGAAEAADKVRLSISSVDVSFLTSGIASKRSFFRDENLDVEIIRMNANVSITALSTGDIDYTMVFASVVRGALRGMPMKVVASFMDSSTHLLIARPEYKSIRDLTG